MSKRIGFYKKDGLYKLYTWKPETATEAAYQEILFPFGTYPQIQENTTMKVTVFSDLELHDDGSLHLDGVSVRNSDVSGDGTISFIRPESVVEFLESAIKLHAQLKKKGLLPKPTKAAKP